MIMTQRLPPVSLMSEDPIHEMSYSALAEYCTREIRKYRRGETSNDQYGLELFRRAIVQRDVDAWPWLQYCFGEIVLSWMRRHPNRDAAYRLESEENFVAQTFERFWQATAHNQRLEFERLSAALNYLRASLNGTILDTLRAYSRPKETWLPEPDFSFPEEPVVEDQDSGQDDSSELWKLLQEILPNEREKRLAYLLFHCGLKPREIVRYCQQEFGDVHEIYRMSRNIHERILRNADQIRWRLGFGNE